MNTGERLSHALQVNTWGRYEADGGFRRYTSGYREAGGAGNSRLPSSTRGEAVEIERRIAKEYQRTSHLRNGPFASDSPQTGLHPRSEARRLDFANLN